MATEIKVFSRESWNCVHSLTDTHHREVGEVGEKEEEEGEG